MDIPSGLPLLSRGNHPAGSGQACIMNAISYLNGDTEITDFPSCTWPVLSLVAQEVNDDICRHRPKPMLCGRCSHQMWKLGARLIGTMDAIAGWSQHERDVLSVRLAVYAARQVQWIVPDAQREAYGAALRAAEDWCDGKISIDKVAVAAIRARKAPMKVTCATYAVRAAAGCRSHGDVHHYDDDFDPDVDPCHLVSVALATAIEWGSFCCQEKVAPYWSQYATNPLKKLAPAPQARAGQFHRILNEFDRLTGHGDERRQFGAEDFDQVVRGAGGLEVQLA